VPDPIPLIQAKSLIRALHGEVHASPAFWFMRQAGRYLPEYRQTRAKAKDFISLCLDPELASEITLQPVRRFAMDGAILFADILLVPHALGQPVAFKEGEGPVLTPIADAAAIDNLKAAAGDALGRLQPVAETVRRVAADLPLDTALLGFAGAPWTVATYMVEGGTSRDFRLVKSFAYRDPRGFAGLIELLTEATIAYLSAQITAGAEAVQLFDSWAGILSETGFERWVIEPTRKIAAALKQRFPTVPVIGFPRGAGLLYERYAVETGVDVVSLDTAVPPGFARDRLQTRLAVQGNLDPVLLIVGGAALEVAVKELRSVLGHGPFVFNLGHGVLPQTPPENVAALARLLAEPLAAS